MDFKIARTKNRMGPIGFIITIILIIALWAIGAAFTNGSLAIDAFTSAWNIFIGWLIILVAVFSAIALFIPGRDVAGKTAKFISLILLVIIVGVIDFLLIQPTNSFYHSF